MVFELEKGKIYDYKECIKTRKDLLVYSARPSVNPINNGKWVEQFYGSLEHLRL
jgi:hypothetical protein